MIIFQWSRPFRFCAACALAGCLALPVAVQAADILLPESTTALTRLQTLGDRASDLALSALSMLGIRYKYGGTTPENGLDCSGLVRYVFKEAISTISDGESYCVHFLACAEFLLEYSD